MRKNFRKYFKFCVTSSSFLIERVHCHYFPEKNDRSEAQMNRKWIINLSLSKVD